MSVCCRSVSLLLFASVHLYVCQWIILSVFPCVCFSFFVSVCPSFHLYDCPTVHQSLYLSVNNPSVYLSPISATVCSSVCLSVSPSLLENDLIGTYRSWNNAIRNLFNYEVTFSSVMNGDQFLESSWVERTRTEAKRKGSTEWYRHGGYLPFPRFEKF